MTRQEQPSRVIRFRLELASAITLVAAVALGACNGGGTSSPPGPIRSTRITEFAVPSKASHPAYIATGSDGALWFTETAANKIGRVATDGTITENATGLSSLSQPMGITGGPDTALWFAEQSAGNIGRTTTSGAVSEYATPSGSPYQITTGADGALWFTEPATNNIGRITPAGAVSEFAVPSGNSPQGIVAGPDGNL